MVIRKLAIANFKVRRTRSALTIAAIMLSVSLIVSVTSGYASIEWAIRHYFDMYMGTFDAQITHQNEQRGGVPGSIVQQLRADPQVRNAVGRLETESRLIDKEGNTVTAHDAMIVGIDPMLDARVQNLAMHEGVWFAAGDGNVAVIDQVAQEVLKVKLGDSFELPTATGKLKLKVVGVIHKPTILASGVQTVYTPLGTLQRALSPDHSDVVTRITIQLAGGVDAEQFAARWRPKIASIDPVLQLKLTRENKQKLDQMLTGSRFLSYLGSVVSMLAATFIIFSSLSMGVVERQRTLAMLRAVGAARGQLGWLVVIEGLLLSVAGMVIGTPLGILWVWFLGRHFKEVFPFGIVVSWTGVCFAASASLGAALIASLLPAWTVMRLSPLEAMSPLADGRPSRMPILPAIFGLLLICIDPLLLFEVPGRIANAIGMPISRDHSRTIGFFGHFFAGLPSLMFGFFLLSPLFVWLIDRIIGPVAAVLFAVKPALLRQQLSGGGLWRSAGTCASLMVGLSILVVMQTQGNTALSGWKLPDKFPDVFIGVFSFGGVPANQADKLKTIPGVKDGQIMPIAIASPELGAGPIAMAAVAVMPDATMFFGVDPDTAFKLMELDFRDGNPRDAQRMLKLGRHLIVTEEFHELKGLHVGSTLSLKTPRHGTVDYTVAGVVWSPGIDVIVSSYDMGRQFDQRTAASVFGTLDDAREDFGVTGYHLFAANLEYGVDKEKLLEQLKTAVGVYGMKIGDVRQIKHDIDQGFRRLLLLVSTVAFAAMAVASLGVTNTVMASVRSRQWQFGVLRSIGLTRGALLRMVLAEAVLIGIVGCGLGLVAGAEMSVDAARLSTITLGYNPPAAPPWGIIWIGTFIVMGLSVLASVWPAVNAARSEPLSLLQAGRAAA